MADEKPGAVKEFGEVPPRLNIVGELFAGGAVPPSLNLAGEAIRGLVPAALPKIPLTQPTTQPLQGQANTPAGSQSSSSDSGGSGSSEKK
jgi:hypothetical protein